MPIRVECECGKVLRLKDELAGKRVRCPGCGDPLSVPADEEPLELELADEPPRKRSLRDEEDEDRPRRPGITARRAADEDDEPTPRRRPDPDEDEAEDEPRPRKKKKKRRPASSYSGVNAGSILAGIGMMVGSVVWFVVGLMNNYIFFYPPVLFILGIIALVKGLMNQE